MTEQERFLRQYEGTARQAARKTGLPVSVILAQWAHETGWGETGLARYHHNLGGIKHTSHADYQPGDVWTRYSGYDSLGAFVRDWSRVLGLAHYDHVRQAAREGRPAEEVAHALGDSPYAESGYVREGQPGQALVDIMRQWRLVERYDNGQVLVTGPGGVQVSRGADGELSAGLGDMSGVVGLVAVLGAVMVAWSIVSGGASQES